MKYESSILKRLIDTYGVIGNPRYLSEIIKEFIVRGKERFPELFTYQADWLAHIDEFGLNPTYTVSYTGQSIYAPNTLERPVKSAILKGNTLINLLDMTQCSTINYLNTQTIKIKQNTIYTIKTTLKESNILISDNSYGFGIKETDNNGNFLVVEQITSGDLHINTTFMNTVSDTIQIRNYNQDKTKIEVMIIEGDYTNVDIPYFTGMQSVRMPVLTTSNEDGTKSNILTVNEDVTLRGIGYVRDDLDLLTGEVTERIGEIVLDGVNISPIVNAMKDQNNTIAFDFKKSFPSLNASFIHSLNDTFPDYTGDDLYISDVEGLARGWDAICVRINKNRLAQANVEGFKQWLQSNPITVQYPMTTESIKTVDLTIHDKDHQKVERLTTFGGGTNFTTSSQDGSLLPTLSVDVVTDLEKTLVVCSLEGNTM